MGANKSTALFILPPRVLARNQLLATVAKEDESGTGEKAELFCLGTLVLSKTISITRGDTQKALRFLVFLIQSREGQEHAFNGTSEMLAPLVERAERAKGSLYEGGLRVPLIVSGPMLTRPGRSTDALVNTTVRDRPGGPGPGPAPGARPRLGQLPEVLTNNPNHHPRLEYV